MKYELRYDRKAVQYAVTWAGGEQIFTMPYATQLWSWFGNTLEPGDSLEWVREWEPGDPLP